MSTTTSLHLHVRSDIDKISQEILRSVSTLYNIACINLYNKRKHALFVLEFILEVTRSTARASHNELAFCATLLHGKGFWKMGNYGVALKGTENCQNDHLVYPKKPMNWRSTFSQCVFFTSAANPNDFGSLGTRWSEPADCFPS